MNKIFDKCTIGGIKLKNRIIRSATFEALADENGRPLQKLTDLYLRLAKGGTGAIITGLTGVQKNGRTSGSMCMIDSDDLIKDYKKMTSELKKTGAPVIIQLAHGGGRTRKAVTGEEAAAPSAKYYKSTLAAARELTEKEIKKIIADFTDAIVRAKKAGFDGAELHAAHGYLLSEFLSPEQNNRNDRWGGSTENRFRIIAEIIKGARKKAGRFPIWAKFSAYDADRNGMRIEEAVKIAELFEKHGADALEISCGSGNDGANSIRVNISQAEAQLKMIPAFRNMPLYRKIIFRINSVLFTKKHTPLFNYNVNAAEEIKKHVNIPVIAVGGIRNIKDIETIISEGKADAVSMSRPFIIEPDIAEKFRSGKQPESRCCNCGYCLIGLATKSLRCYNGKIPAK